MTKTRTLIFLIMVIMFFGMPIAFAGYGGDPYECTVDGAGGTEICGLVLLLELEATTSNLCGGMVNLDWGWYDPDIHYIIDPDLIEYTIWKNGIFFTKVIGVTNIDVIANTGDIFKVSSSLSPESEPDSAIPSDSCPFGAPSLSTTTASCGGKVSLSWTSVLDAIEYKVFKNNNQIATTTETSLEVMASLEDVFTVKAISNSDESGASNPVSTIPSSVCLPSTPILSAIMSSSCGGKVSLSWTSVLDAIKYKVFKNNNQIATTTETSMEVIASVDDIFVIKAVSVDSDSEASNSVSAIPSDICIDTPVLFVSTASSCGEKVHLSWTSIIGAVNYKVFKNGEQITSTANTYLEVIANFSDVFTVKAFSVTGESSVSNPVSAKPSAACPLGLLTLEAGTGDSCGEKVYLSWNDFTDAFQYRVFKNDEQIVITTKTHLEVLAVPADIFTVRADLRSGESENSNPVSAIPSASCDCRGAIPDYGFERCPGTIISADNTWTLVSSCPATNPGNCEYRATSGDIAEPPATTTVIIEEVKKFFESETGSIVTKVVTTAGVVSGGVAVTGAFASTAATDLFFLPFKLWGLLLSIFGLKRRNRPWGTVYDSVTKQPIDPAYVTLTNLDTKEENTSITDLDGRYGFLVSLGRYIISANKTNYTFPSKKLFGKTEDELYTNLYFGEELKIETDNALINKNIPMDPIKFDWNEFVKGKKKLMRFYSRRKKFLSILSDWLFRIGFVISAISLFLVPAPYNLVIFFLYVLLVIIRKFGLKQKALGSLTERDGGPLSFAIIRVFDSELNVEITNKVADKIGRYYCLVSKGKYYVKVEKKNDDESYSIVHTSEIFNAENGIINKNFVV